jgi:signal transduction histidine kinase
MLNLWESWVPALESGKGSTYYALLALLLLSAASLLLQNRARPVKLDGRVNLALGVLMGLRLIELPVFVQAWLGQAAAQQASAPLERGILLTSFVILAWLWARPNGESKQRQLVFGAELLVAIAATALLIFMWLGAVPSAAFNYTNVDYAWNAICMAVLLIGLVQIFTSPARPRLGLLHLGILLVGQIAHLFLAEPFGNMPLAAQAAQLISLLLLFVLPVSVAAKREARVKLKKDKAAEEDTPAPNVEAAFNKPAFFDFEEEPGAEPAAARSGALQPAEALARQIAENLHANLCLLATMNDAQKQLELQYGFNLLRSAPIEPARIPLREMPRLASALQRGRPLRLAAEPKLAELGVLSQALRLSFPGHLLASPFTYSQDLRRWAVLLINVERPWQLEDEVALEKTAADLGTQLASALGLNENKSAAAQLVAPVTEELNQARQELEELTSENQRFREDVDRLLIHIDELQTAQAAAGAAESGEVVTALQQENEKLKNALASLEASGGGPRMSIDATQAKEELRLALEELASLQAKLDAAQAAMLEAGTQPAGSKISGDQVELIASIAQELRQPLSSILGYTDLLLGESVGILGALQRKFLDRVRSSTERMNKLIDDLIRIAELDRGGVSVQRKPVDLSAVFDDAIAQLRAQLQEKRITLRVDLPRQMPQLNTDRDALQQILYHLLQNADAATPAEGSITLRAVVEQQPELGEFVLMQVSDSGGGIPEEDLPRVFSRVYRATNPLIQGVGDSGVGLTIAETLTVALGGRIWVESEAGKGATFSVLLPLQPQAAPAGLAA